ncbi:MAG: right-handed parallel beta-helix repeat-containing protein [Acidobacteriaceae bacterium]|nr:right-handed parallel beta-helix repeat-containing protein [Acidobacteriaceae bacterium]
MRIARFVFALSFFYLEASGYRERATTVEIQPGMDLQGAVDSHPEGTAFLIAPGLYRLSTPIRPKNGDSFIGQVACAPPQTTCPAILNGSRVLPPGESSGNGFRIAGQTPHAPTQDPKHCEPGFPRCIYPQDLYLDQKPLTHRDSADGLNSGSWFFDDAAHAIYLRDNPSGHLLEIGESFAAFDASPANNVAVKNLTIEKFASQTTLAAVGTNVMPSPETGANWVVENNEIRLNHGSGVRINFGWRIRNNYIHHNGNLGIGGGMGLIRSTQPSRVLIEGNEISYNNYARVKPGFGAGGVKINVARGLIFRNNYSHHNQGSGFHADTDNIDLLVDGNTITDNTDEGAFVEISYSGTVRNNKLFRNGFPDAEHWLYGANLLSSTSRNVEAYCNTIEVSAQGGNGMDIIAQPRKGYTSGGNFFHHNSVVFDGNSGLTGGGGADPSEPDFYSENRFDYNAYHLPNVDRPAFAWAGKRNTFDEFRAAGQEAHGTVDKLTGATPDVVITSPLDGASISGNVAVTGNARANGASVVKAELDIDWSPQASQSSSPFNFSWDAASAATGRHVLAVTVYNRTGVWSCYAITVNVGVQHSGQ